MRIRWAADVNGATNSAPGVRPALPIFLTFEDGQHVCERPTLGSVLRPSVIVALHAARPHHGIDAAAAAKYMTKSHVECAIVQLRRRGDGHVVVERSADIVKPDARVRDGRSVVGSSRFDDEDLRAGRGQFCRKNTTGGACAHHDEVVVTLDFFIRCVDHWTSFRAKIASGQ